MRKKLSEHHAAQKWQENPPIKVQIWPQKPEVGENYITSDERKMEDSSDCVPISTSKSESEVKIIGTSAELKRED